MVLIESGIRMHTTLYIRDKSITPSGFCIKVSYSTTFRCFGCLRLDVPTRHSTLAV